MHVYSRHTRSNDLARPTRAGTGPVSIRHAHAGLCLGALAIWAAACSETGASEVGVSETSAAEIGTSASEIIAPTPQALVSGTPYPIALQTSQTGRYLCAEFGGGAQLSADRQNVGPWEKFTLLDLNGGALVSGDAINILAPDGGHFVTVQLQGAPSYPVAVTSTTAGTAERFTLVKLVNRDPAPAGTAILDGDSLALQASNGLHVSAELGGATGQPVNANRTSIGDWETFRLIINRSWSPPPGFVGVRDGHFYLDGQRFKHAGVNTQALLYETPAQAESNLKQMAAVGIRHVRLLIANTAYSTSEIIGRLSTLLASAKVHGIKLTLALTGNYDSPSSRYFSDDGRGGKLHPMGDDTYFTYHDPEFGLYLYDRPWLASGYNMNYRPFVQNVVSAFRDDPTVFAWEIAGEVKDPRYTNDHSSPDNEPFKRFYELMPAYIKSLDPNHLVGAGILNTIHPGLRPAYSPTCGGNLDHPNCREALKFYQNPRIDFVASHSYFDGGQNPADAIAAGNPNPLDKDGYPASVDRDIAEWTAKPFMVAEVGFSASGFADPADEMRKYYDLAYHAWDADVVMPWGVQLGDFKSGDSKYGPYEQDRARPGQLCKYKHLWRTYASELGWDNPGLVFDCGSFKDTSSLYSGIDWDSCRGKTTCAVGDTIAGLSMEPGGQGRTALCKRGATGGYTGNVTATLQTDSGLDQRRAQRLGDWATGYLKLECGAGEYVSAVSENSSSCQGNNRFHAIQCSAGQGLGDDCLTLAFDTGDNRGSRSAFLSGDWDFGAYKGECGVYGYLAGVSVSPTTGAPHSLLCCAPSVDNGTIWGVDSASRIFRYTGGAQVWWSIPGQMAQVSVGGPSSVWALNSSNQIFRWTGSSWTQVPGFPGSPKQISAGHDGWTWGVNSSGAIYRYVGGTQIWQQVPGLLSQVAVGNASHIWGLNLFNGNHLIYRWNGSGWDLIPGALDQISVGGDGTVWGVYNNKIYRYVGGTQGWQLLSGLLSQVAVGDANHVWGLNLIAGNHLIYRWTGVGWELVPGSLSQISVGFGY
jgi:hypothetical protein